MKWERAVQVGNDVHFTLCVDPDKCGTAEERHEHATYGVDDNFTPQRAAEEFALLVKAKYAVPQEKHLSFEGLEESTDARSNHQR